MRNHTDAKNANLYLRLIRTYLRPPFREDQSKIIRLIRIRTILFDPWRYKLFGFLIPN